MTSLGRATLVAIGVVLLRSDVWSFWEQAHFDSDQAIFGLMAAPPCGGSRSIRVQDWCISDR